MQNQVRQAKVISLEGGEGSGKSTVLAHLEAYFKKYHMPVMFTREPGGVRIAEKIRAIILDVDHTEMDARTEALLYASARRQHLAEKVMPALKEGKWVIFDRYVDSSIVYQGYCRGIGMDEVYQLNCFATEGFLPDLTLYLDVEPSVGLARVMENSEREVNRLDLEHLDFHIKVREGYHLLMEKFPNRMVKVDANLPIDQVLEQITSILDSFVSQNAT